MTTGSPSKPPKIEVIRRLEGEEEELVATFEPYYCFFANFVARERADDNYHLLLREEGRTTYDSHNDPCISCPHMPEQEYCRLPRCDRGKV
jgi:hypothetical protein